MGRKKGIISPRESKARRDIFHWVWFCLGQIVLDFKSGEQSPLAQCSVLPAHAVTLPLPCFPAGEKCADTPRLPVTMLRPAAPPPQGEGALFLPSTPDSPLPTLCCPRQPSGPGSCCLSVPICKVGDVSCHTRSCEIKKSCQRPAQSRTE